MKEIKLIWKKEQKTSDLDKCIYCALEKISSGTNNISSESDKKPYSIILLGASGGRIDHSMATFQSVHNYPSQYCVELANTEIYLFSKSSFCVFLKSGVNVISPSKKYENREEGYSIMSLLEPTYIQVSETEKDKETFNADKNLKFGTAIFFRKKAVGDKIKIFVNGNDSSLPLYSTTTIFHKK